MSKRDAQDTGKTVQLNGRDYAVWMESPSLKIHHGLPVYLGMRNETNNHQIFWLGAAALKDVWCSDATGELKQLF